jgi:hypothetical protein
MQIDITRSKVLKHIFLNKSGILTLFHLQGYGCWKYYLMVTCLLVMLIATIFPIVSNLFLVIS